MDRKTVLEEAVLSTSSDAIIAADKAGNIFFWNPGAERIFGYSSADAVGDHWTSSSRTGSGSATGTAIARS